MENSNELNFFVWHTTTICVLLAEFETNLSTLRFCYFGPGSLGVKISKCSDFPLKRKYLQMTENERWICVLNDNLCKSLANCSENSEPSIIRGRKFCERLRVRWIRAIIYVVNYRGPKIAWLSTWQLWKFEWSPSETTTKCILFIVSI